MDNKEIEAKRNELNMLIRKALYIMDLVDGKHHDYDNYTEGSLNENDFLKQQIELMQELVTRHQAIFK